MTFTFEKDEDYKQFINFMARLKHKLHDIALKPFLGEEQELTRTQTFFYLQLCLFLQDTATLITAKNPKSFGSYRYTGEELAQPQKDFDYDVTVEYCKLYRGNLDTEDLLYKKDLTPEEKERLKKYLETQPLEDENG